MFTTHERSRGKPKHASTVRRTSGRGYAAPVRKYLERSNLELLSVQEELRAMHDELNGRYAELAHLHAELTAQLACIPIPIVLVGRDLSLTFFNTSAAEALQLSPHDRQRRLSETALSGLLNLVAHALDSNLRVEREVQSPHGRWCSITIRPFTPRSRTPGGVLIVWSDIDSIYRARENERALRTEAERVSEHSEDVLRHVTVALQAPLEDIRGFTGLLRSVHLDESEYRQTLKTIEQKADAQRRRIDAVLADTRQAED